MIPTGRAWIRRLEPAFLGVALAALAHVPVARWIGLGRGVEALEPNWSRWLVAGSIALGAGVVLAILAPGSSRLVRWLLAGARAAGSDPRRWGLALGAATSLVTAGVAWEVFDRAPLLIDEIVQVLQARLFESGRLWRPVEPEPAFTSLMHIVDVDGKWFGQFPPGWSLLIAPFDALGASWLAGPAMAGVAAWGFTRWSAVAEPDAATRWAATLLFAFAPFVVFLGGSHMNHLPALALCLLGAGATGRGVGASPGGATWRPAVGAGVAFGAAATIRPVDALAWCVPFGAWWLAATWRDRPRRAAPVAFALGAAVPVAGLLWYNAQTTGSPLLFGYEQLWGPSHRLGFHEAPWGPAHTPARGLRNLHVAMVQMQRYGLEGLLPSVSLATLALVLWRRLSAPDRALAAAAVMTCVLYFLYWHDGFFLGPRFYLPVWPLLATWIARLPRAVAGAWPSRPTVATVAGWTVAAGVVGGWPAQLPYRLAQYGEGMVSMRWNADVEAARAGATGGLVFVREPWGGRVIARLWRLGVSRVATERLYRHTDLCRMELATDSLAAAGLRGERLARALEPLLVDSARVRRAPFSIDDSQRWLPGSSYPPSCWRAVVETAQGTTPLAPRLLARDGTRYVRSLGPRDTLLLAAEPTRRAWLLTANPAVGSRPVYRPLDRDSAWRAARGGR